MRVFPFSFLFFFGFDLRTLVIDVKIVQKYLMKVDVVCATKKMEKIQFYG